MPKYKDKETQRAEKYAKVSQLSEDMAKWVTNKDELDFLYIHEFNSSAVLSIMGSAVSDMAKPILQEIV